MGTATFKQGPGGAGEGLLHVVVHYPLTVWASSRVGGGGGSTGLSTPCRVRLSLSGIIWEAEIRRALKLLLLQLLIQTRQEPLVEVD